MRLLSKGTCALVIFTILLALTSQLCLVHSATVSTIKDKALVFIQEVIQPDMSKNKLTLVNDIVGQPILHSSATQESVMYHLSNSGNGSDIICLFTNNVLTEAQLSTTDSSPLSNNLPAGISARALATFNGYQTFTGEKLSNMINALANVDVAQNLTKISGNIKLTIQNSPFGTDISMKYTYNGTDYTGISFTFRNGSFYSMMDDRSLYTIGNTDVNINKSQAIDIANQYVQNYSYTLDDGTVVKEFNVTSIEATSNFYPRDNTTTVYPYWSVQLNLGQTYPGNVYALVIGIWAGSGKVFLSQPIGVEGSFPTVSSATQSGQTQSHSQIGISAINVSMAIGVVSAVAIISVIAVKKRSKYL